MLTQTHTSLIAKHLRGEASPKEEAQLLAWMEADAENKRNFERLSKVWEAMGKLPDDFALDEEADWKLVKQKFQSASAKKGKLLAFFPPSATVWKAAAAIVLMIGLSYLATMLFTYEINQVYTTASGEEAKIMLPDSSLIWLRENSRLSFSADFNNQERQVTLSGEAFFEVRKSKGRSFKVFSGQSVTEVLGTSFTVRGYESEGFVSVKVKTGKVAFAPAKETDKKVYLLPGDSASLNTKNFSILLEAKHEEAIQETLLQYNDVRLSEIFEELEEKYGITADFEDETIANCRFTGSFANADINTVLKVLSVSLDLTFQTTHNHYIISGKGCK